MAAPTPPAEAPDAARPRRSKLPLVLGLALAALGGAGGFAAVRLGLLGGEAPPGEAAAAAAELPPLPPAAFVPLTPIVVNLPGSGDRRFLRFAAQVEVDPAYLEEVAALTPRIVDVLNGYLRALEVSDIEDPGALLRLRSQMLRRAQVVAGGDRVRDLLVMEFVVN